MRRYLFVAGLALCICLESYAQHAPIPNVAACPATTDEFGNPVMWTFVPLPQFSLFVAHGPVNFTPCVGQYDFCAYADICFCSLAPLSLAFPELADFQPVIQCMHMDINGPVAPEAAIPVTGNGIPDAQYELAVLARILNDANQPLHAAATASYQEYFVNISYWIRDALAAAELKSDKDIRGLIQAAAPYFAGALTSLLAGMATMGDDATNLALDELLNMLEVIGLTPPEGGIASLGVPVPQLGPNGDADGDSFSNRREYVDCHSWHSCPASYYVDIALDPEQIPSLPVTCFNLSGLKSRYNIGDDIAITAHFYCYTPLSYVWKKSGVMLLDQTSATLFIANAQASDSGDYSLTFTIDDGSGEIISITKFFLVDIVNNTMPISTMLFLSLLASACAVGGAVRICRR